MRPPIWTFLRCRAFVVSARNAGCSQGLVDRGPRRCTATRGREQAVYMLARVQLTEQEERMERVSGVSATRSGDQSRGGSGSLVGRRSSVSRVAVASGLWAQGHVQRLAVACLDRLGERDELREAPSQHAGDPVDGAVGEVRASVLDVRESSPGPCRAPGRGSAGTFRVLPGAGRWRGRARLGVPWRCWAPPEPSTQLMLLAMEWVPYRRTRLCFAAVRPSADSLGCRRAPLLDTAQQIGWRRAEGASESQQRVG